MAQHPHELLEVLRFELNYLEQGSFDRDRAFLGIESPFLGTFTCINFGDPLQAHTCRQCLLHQFIPGDKQNEEIPCHHIPLNASGETIAELIEKKDPKAMVAALEDWLRVKIAALESTLNGSVEQ